MSEAAIYIITGLAVYYAVLLTISLWNQKNQTEDDFSIGRRNVGIIPTSASLVSGFRDGAGIVFWVGAGLTLGYGGLWLIAGVFCGLLFYIFYGPRIRALATQQNYISIGEIIRDRIGSLTKTISALIIIAFSLMYVAMQLYVSGNLVANILDYEAWTGVVSVAAIIGIYLYFGGYSNVIKTDTVQFFLIFSLIAIPFFLPPAEEQLLDFSSLTSMGTQGSIAFLLIGIFWMLSSAEIWQRVFSTRNDNVLRTSFLSAAPLLLIMTLSLIFLGFGVAQITGGTLEADEVFFAIFKDNLLSAPLQAYIAVIAMAITMSTLDTFCYLGASSFAKDILPARKGKTGEKATNYMTITRLFMLGSLIVMGLVAIFISDIVQFLFDSSSLLFILAPVYAFTVLELFRPHKNLDKFLCLSTLACVILYVYLFSTGAFANMLLIVLPAAVNLFFCSVIVFFTNHAKTADSNAPSHPAS